MAVERFLERRISFLEIYEIIEDCMASVKMVEKPSLQEILEAEKAVSEHIRSRWDQTYPEA
jgi:1-deoxy-D-xylulose-5-phosphate reductoisomerase